MAASVTDPGSQFPRIDRTLVPLLFLSFVILYSLLTVGNRTEVDDSFWFAYDAQNSPLRILVGGLHSRHLLYLPLIRGLLTALESVGISLDPYTLMRYVSVVFAAASIPALWLLLTKRFRVSPLGALACALGFALSYGYWRYANEAEAYSIAILLALVLCLVGIRDSYTYPSAIVIGLIAALGTLIYTGNAVVGFTVVPVAMISLRQYRILASYLVVFMLVYGFVTYGVYLAVSPGTDGYAAYVMGRSNLTSEASGGLGMPQAVGTAPSGFNPSLRSIPEGMIAFQSDVVTSNFLLTYPPVTERLQTSLANKPPSGSRTLQEELYVGTHTSDVPRVLAVVSLLVLVSLAVRLLVTSRRRWKVVAPTNRVLGVGLWLVAYAATLMLLGSALAPEAWIPVLLPFWMLVAIFLFEPSARGGHFGLVIATVAVLFVHNLIGGLWIMRSADTDYNAVKSGWLVTTASSNDIILTADTITFFRYLRYHARARVLEATQVPADGLRASITQSASRGGHVYATADVLGAIRSSATLSLALESAGVQREEFQNVHDDAFGGVYCLC